jgi:uncharacterized membrane protein
METGFQILAGAASLASALVGGVFLTFSDFVMRSLDEAHERGGIEAMQIVNREVFNGLFMVLLIGTSVAAPVLAVAAHAYVPGPAAAAMTFAAASYVAGVFAVTLFFNVPRNVRLDRLDPTVPAAAQYWTEDYYPRWTWWNHVRTASAALAALGFLLAAVWFA